MNSVAGGVVYTGGELVVQFQSYNQPYSFTKPPNLDWLRIGEIAALGSAENGVFMYAW